MPIASVNQLATRIEVPLYAIGNKFIKRGSICFKKMQIKLILNEEKIKKKVITQKDLNEVEALSFKEVIKYLKRNEVQIKECISEGYLKPWGYILPNYSPYFLKSDLDYIIQLRNEFYQSYYNYAEARKYITEVGWNQLNIIEVPVYAKGGKFHHKISAVSKAEVKRLLQEGKYIYDKKNDVDDALLYSTEEVCKILNLNLQVLNPLCKQNKISIIKKKRKNFYYKKDIDSLRKEQIKLIMYLQKEFITYQEACDRYSNSFMMTIDNVEKCSVELLARGFYPGIMTL